MNLPKDIAKIVLLYLDIHDLVALSKTNNFFNDICKENIENLKPSYLGLRALNGDITPLDFSRKTVIKSVYFDKNSKSEESIYDKNKNKNNNVDDDDNYYSYKKDDIINKIIIYYKIIIEFKNTDVILKMTAQDSCCDTPWFEIYDVDFSYMKDKTIKDIDEIPFEKSKFIEPQPSGLEGYDTNHLMRITFIEGEPFYFLMRDNSNGYYDATFSTNVERLKNIDE